MHRYANKLAVLLLFPVACLAQGGIIGGSGGIGGNAQIGPTASSFYGLTLVHTESNNYASCIGVSSCVYALPNNPTSGNLLTVAADLAANTATISGSGTGCPASWIASPENPVGSSLFAIYAWYGVAAGTGSCTVTVTPGASSNVGVTVVELTGQGASPLDAHGNCSNVSGSTCTGSAGSATTFANDFAIMFWACKSSSTPAATGWTLSVNNNFDGIFTQASISYGTTVSFSGTGFAVDDTEATMVVFHP